MDGENGGISKNARGLLGKTYPLRKKATRAKEPDWTLRLEEWGTNKAIEDMGYAHKNGSALQQEIARREQATRRHHRHQKQLEIILAWRDAERYLRGDKKKFNMQRIE